MELTPFTILSSVGHYFSLFQLSINFTSAVKQRHLEEVCKEDLDGEKAARVLQWGADLVKYYRSLEPGIFPPR